MMQKELRKVPIHRALIRPILLAGGERELVILNMTLAFAMIIGVGINEFTILSALFLGVIGQIALSRLGKADPMMSRVYKRHIHYKNFYPARGSRLAPPSIIHSSIS